MPLYEFVCESCGEVFEEIIRNGEENPSCPVCGKSCRRNITAPAPLKTGAFPYKPGPPMKLGNGGACGPSCGSCGGNN